MALPNLPAPPLTIKMPPEESVATPVPVEKPAITVSKQAVEQFAQNYAAQNVEPLAVTPAATLVPATPLTIKLPPVEPVAALTTATQPAVPTAIFDSSYKLVPQTMKTLNRWLAFEVTWNPTRGKFDKNPVNSRGVTTNKPEDAEPFETMFAYVNSRKGAVLGFYIEDPYIGIDIDDCRDPKTGVINAKVMEIVRALNSYAEVSPSGTGIRILITGVKPGDSCRKGSAEIHFHKRGVTITGLQIEGTPATVNPADVTNLYNRMMNGEFFTEKQRASYAKKGASSDIMVSTSNLLTTKLQVLTTGDVQSLKPFEMSDGLGTSIFYDSSSEAVQGLLRVLQLNTRTAKTMSAWKRCAKTLKIQNFLRDFRTGTAARRSGILGNKEIKRALGFIKKNAATKAAASAAPAAPTNVPEDLKATSLLIFGTTPEAELATSLGYNALVASELNHRLTPRSIVL